MRRTKKSLRRLADKLWSECVKRRARWKCEICGKEGNLQAHHIISRRNMATRYDLDNGIALCPACHFQAHQNPIRFIEEIKRRRGAEWYRRMKEKSLHLTKGVDYDRIIEELKQCGEGGSNFIRKP